MHFINAIARQYFFLDSHVERIRMEAFQQAEVCSAGQGFVLECYITPPVSTSITPIREPGFWDPTSWLHRRFAGIPLSYSFKVLLKGE